MGPQLKNHHRQVSAARDGTFHLKPDMSENVLINQILLLHDLEGYLPSPEGKREILVKNQLCEKAFVRVDAKNYPTNSLSYC
jgi:hypothetical protein